MFYLFNLFILCQVAVWLLILKSYLIWLIWLGIVPRIWLAIACTVAFRILIKCSSVVTAVFLPHAMNCRSCFGAVSRWFFVCVWNISEPLNGFAPNSHGRCVWSLAEMSLKVKWVSNFFGKGHQGQKMAFFSGLHVFHVWQSIVSSSVCV